MGLTALKTERMLLNQGIFRLTSHKSSGYWLSPRSPEMSLRRTHFLQGASQINGDHIPSSQRCHNVRDRTLLLFKNTFTSSLFTYLAGFPNRSCYDLIFWKRWFPSNHHWDKSRVQFLKKKLWTCPKRCLEKSHFIMTSLKSSTKS